MKSRAYKYGGKLFRYDFDDCMVEYIVKANAEMRKDNKEWMEEFGKPMWEIDESGYCIIDRVGLRRENWKDKESRDYYLSTWLDDIAAEVAFEEAMFMKYEYPQLVEEGVV